MIGGGPAARACLCVRVWRTVSGGRRAERGRRRRRRYPCHDRVTMVKYFLKPVRGRGSRSISNHGKTHETNVMISDRFAVTIDYNRWRCHPTEGWKTGKQGRAPSDVTRRSGGFSSSQNDGRHASVGKRNLINVITGPRKKISRGVVHVFLFRYSFRVFLFRYSSSSDEVAERCRRINARTHAVHTKRYDDCDLCLCVSIQWRQSCVKLTVGVMHGRNENLFTVRFRWMNSTGMLRSVSRDFD